MSWNPMRSLMAGAVTTALLVPVATSSAAVVYREIFPNATGDNLANGEAGGWYLHQGATGVSQTAAFTLSGGDGMPADVEWVNAGNVGTPTADEMAKGYLFRGGNNSGEHLYWTDEYSLSLDTWTLESVSWYQRNGNAGGSGAGDLIRVALRVGDDWYVSKDTFTNPADTWQQNTLTVDTSTKWYALAFEAGTTLAMDISEELTLPTTGTLSAFGLYTDLKTGGSGRFHRVDTYTINAVPEPATLGLVSLGGLLMLRRRGRLS